MTPIAGTRKLEDLIAWYYGFQVQGWPDHSRELGLNPTEQEKQRTIVTISPEDMASLVELALPWRADIEQHLLDFNPQVHPTQFYTNAWLMLPTQINHGISQREMVVRDKNLMPGGKSAPEGQSVEIDYTNYKGERGVRKIIPFAAPFYGTTQYHPEPQYLLKAWDVEKNAERTFALTDIHRWGNPTLLRMEEADFHNKEVLNISMIDLMEAASVVSSLHGHMNGTTNWAASMMQLLQKASKRNAYS